MNIHEYSIDLKWSQYNSVYMSLWLPDMIQPGKQMALPDLTIVFLNRFAFWRWRLFYWRSTLYIFSIVTPFLSIISLWTLVGCRSLFERPALTHFSGGSIQKVFSVSLRSLVRLFSPCKGLNRYTLESQQFNTINIGHCHQCGQTWPGQQLDHFST